VGRGRAPSDQQSARSFRLAAHISAAEWGGAERRTLVLLAGLAERGLDVRVFTNTEHIALKAAERGLRAQVLPLRGDAVVSNAVAFARALAHFQPDALILATFKRLWLGALAARIAGVPRVIARVGLATDIARNRKYRFVLRRWIDDVVVNAHSLHAPFDTSLAAGSRVRVTTIPNGVEMPHASLARAEARRALGIPGDAFVVGTVARLVTQKRIDRLLHALAVDTRVHAVITGEGALRAELETLAATLGVRERAHFTGARENIGDVHAALDAYVVTSDQEGMSNAMLEALASGLPVVSTPVSGADEALLGEPRCGLVVEGSPVQLASAFDTLRDDTVRAALGAAGARVATERYGLATMVDAWHRLLMEQAP